jgi:hypothetical protein
VRGGPQIVYGCSPPPPGSLSPEVFKGSTCDPATLASEVKNLKQRFGLAHVSVAGGRGMLTQAWIRDDVKPAELD